MTKNLLVWRAALVVSLVGGTWAGGADGRGSVITTPNGCSQEFRGNKGVIKTCEACVRGTGRYRLSAATKSWKCETSGSSSNGGGSSGGETAQKTTSEAPVTAPTTLSRHYSDYAVVPAGTFKIGSPDTEQSREPLEYQATVTLTRAFFMKKTEVTEGEWHVIMGEASKSYKRDCGADCPVADVTWEQTLEYLNNISKREKLEPCYDLSAKLAVWTKGLDCAGYRLPTEAEWEYAARAGSTGARYGEVGEIAWYKDNSNGKPHPVATKKPNAFGLYDMLGSVSEWIWDAYRYDAFNPGDGASRTDPITGGIKQEAVDLYSTLGFRIYKGGNYGEYAGTSRAAYRFKRLPAQSNWDLGFRPVRTKK